MLLRSPLPQCILELIILLLRFSPLLFFNAELELLILLEQSSPLILIKRAFNLLEDEVLLVFKLFLLFTLLSCYLLQGALDLLVLTSAELFQFLLEPSYLLIHDDCNLVNSVVIEFASNYDWWQHFLLQYVLQPFLFVEHRLDQRLHLLGILLDFLRPSLQVVVQPVLTLLPELSHFFLLLQPPLLQFFF